MNDNSMYRDAIRKPLVNSLIESEQDSQIPESLLWQLSKEEKAVSLYHFLIDNVQSQGICVKEIDMEGLCSAAAAKIAGKKVIGIEKTDPPEEKVFSLAHEISHILLGHLENHSDEDKCERQADFAAGILLDALCLVNVGKEGIPV